MALRAAIATLVLVACTTENRVRALDADAPPSPEPIAVTDRIAQALLPELDVLWVVDDSGSMADEQEALAAAFPAFAAWLGDAGVDWHVAVITTTRVGSDVPLREVDGIRVLDPDTPELEATFAELARVGTDGSGSEQPLGAVFTALELDVDDNRDFYRDGAALDVVVLSDEDDDTPPSFVDPSAFVAWFSALKVQRDARRLSALAPTSARTTREVATALDGTIAELPGADPAAWEAVLDALGARATAPKERWYTSREPLPDTLEVTWEIGTERVSPDGWTYDATTGSVSFAEPPPPGTTVVLEYLAW